MMIHKKKEHHFEEGAECGVQNFKVPGWKCFSKIEILPELCWREADSPGYRLHLGCLCPGQPLSKGSFES